jgi:NADPH:quinone reductase-like Zn-dependent oxidoreductase
MTNFEAFITELAIAHGGSVISLNPEMTNEGIYRVRTGMAERHHAFGPDHLSDIQSAIAIVAFCSTLFSNRLGSQ